MRKFGVEVEGFTSLRSDTLAAALRNDTGINVRSTGWQRASTDNDVWTITTDGSIKHPETKEKGKELVSPPLQGTDESYEQLRKLLRALRSKKVLGDNILKVDKQCSVHVHIDRSDLSDDDLKKVYTLYSIIEPKLNLMFPDSRRNNKGRGGKSYCAPIASVPFKEAFEERSRADLKYYSLQFPEAIPTIEFRIHGASTNPKKIWYWIRIVNEIINYAVNLPVIEVWDKKMTEDFKLVEILISKDLYEYYLGRVESLKDK